MLNEVSPIMTVDTMQSLRIVIQNLGKSCLQLQLLMRAQHDIRAPQGVSVNINSVLYVRVTDQRWPRHVSAHVIDNVDKRDMS